MPRCSDTNKFASYDDMELEVNSYDISGTTIDVSVRAVRPCADCGEELAEYEFQLEAEVACPTCGTECPWCDVCDGTGGEDGETCQACLGSGEDEANQIEIEFTLDEEPEFEATDRNQTTDRHGKTIKNFRYQKRLLGVSSEALVFCEHCQEEFGVVLEDEVQASAFEILV